MSPNALRAATASATRLSHSRRLRPSSANDLIVRMP